MENLTNSFKGNNQKFKAKRKQRQSDKIVGEEDRDEEKSLLK